MDRCIFIFIFKKPHVEDQAGLTRCLGQAYTICKWLRTSVKRPCDRKGVLS